VRRKIRRAVARESSQVTDAVAHAQLVCIQFRSKIRVDGTHVIRGGFGLSKRHQSNHDALPWLSARLVGTRRNSYTGELRRKVASIESENPSISPSARQKRLSKGFRPLFQTQCFAATPRACVSSAHVCIPAHDGYQYLERSGPPFPTDGVERMRVPRGRFLTVGDRPFRIQLLLAFSSQRGRKEKIKAKANSLLGNAIILSLSGVQKSTCMIKP